MAYLLVLAGIGMLGLGAMWLVDGASRIALRLGMSPLVVGLTVVGFGTSMPEFMVSVLAAGRGSGALSVGNAVGSNVMNLLLVLGAAAVIREIRVVGRSGELNRNIIFGLIPAAVLLVGAWNGDITRGVALMLLLLFFAFLWTALSEARRHRAGSQEVSGSLVRQIGMTILGMVMVSVGAESLVRGGTELARGFGVSEALIGLTLVAFGTSLPELAASVVAAAKGESEMSVGNVLGSNVFNLGLVVGSAFTIRPGRVPTEIIRQDIPLLALATVVLGLGMLRDGRIKRLEGIGLLAAFSAYLIFVVVRGG